VTLSGLLIGSTPDVVTEVTTRSRWARPLAARAEIPPPRAATSDAPTKTDERRITGSAEPGTPLLSSEAKKVWSGVGLLRTSDRKLRF
jgi:hypothetical protein